MSTPIVPRRPGLDPRWRFVLVAGGLYLLWLLVYEGYILPDGRLDHYLSLNLAEASAGLLRGLGFGASYQAGQPLLYMDGLPAVVVGTPCDGMALYVLFAGFVLALPGPWRAKAWFIPAGIGGLYLLNVLRIAGLALNHHYAHRSVEFNHHYTFTFVVYGVIGLLWVWWARHYGPPAPAAS